MIRKGVSIEMIDLRKNILYSVNDNSFIGFDNTLVYWLIMRLLVVLFIQQSVRLLFLFAICKATIPR